MNNPLLILRLSCLAIGCAWGQWVKEGAPLETVQRDFGECQLWAWFSNRNLRRWAIKLASTPIRAAGPLNNACEEKAIAGYPKRPVASRRGRQPRLLST